MILSSHALIGAAAARIFTSNPLLAFIIGIISHYISDAVPHWQYPLRSLMKVRNDSKEGVSFFRKDTVRDLLCIGLDIFFGLLLLIYFFRADGSGNGEFLFATAMGALGGLFPDALQFLYWLVPKKLFNPHQKFHDWVHAKNDFDPGSIRGVLIQIIIVTLCVFISKMVR